MNSAPTTSYVFRAHKTAVNTLCFFEDGKYFASGDGDGVVIVWKMQTRRPALQWRAHDQSCLAIIHYSNNKLITQGRDDIIHAWQLQLHEDQQPSKEKLFSIPYESIGFCKLSFCQTPDNGAIVCFPHHGDTSMIDIYSLEKQKWVQQNIGDASKKCGMCMAVETFFRDGKLYILAGYEDGSVALWQGSNCQWQLKKHDQPILDLAVHDTIGISTSADNQIVKYNLFESSPSIQNASIKKHGLAAVDIRSDGKILATGGHDGRIRVFSLKTLKPLAIMNYHRDSAYAVAFGPVKENAEHWLLGGSKDGRISLWNIY